MKACDLDGICSTFDSTFAKAGSDARASAALRTSASVLIPWTFSSGPEVGGEDVNNASTEEREKREIGFFRRHPPERHETYPVMELRTLSTALGFQPLLISDKIAGLTGL